MRYPKPAKLAVRAGRASLDQELFEFSGSTKFFPRILIRFSEVLRKSRRVPNARFAL